MKIRQFFRNSKTKYKRILKRNQTILEIVLDTFSTNKILKDIMFNHNTIINKNYKMKIMN